MRQQGFYKQLVFSKVNVLLQIAIPLLTLSFILFLGPFRNLRGASKSQADELAAPSSEGSSFSSASSIFPSVLPSHSIHSVPVASVHHTDAAPTTSCSQLIYIGDSTSLGLNMRMYIPKVEDQIEGRYRSVGVKEFFPEISGARSMVETYKDQPNATMVVRSRKNKGYKGCWVFALGTNDPANLRGNVTTLGERIDRIMALIQGAPAMWTTTKTRLSKGSYDNQYMTQWRVALLDACKRHRNMRVYDWASEVQDSWFLPDGIHFNSPGYIERAHRLAMALAKAFPVGKEPEATCLVQSGVPIIEPLRAEDVE